MYSLVDVDPKKEYGVARLPEWKTVQDGLKRNLVAMLEHYRHASYSVASDHLLVQLIQSFNVPLSLNSERYHSNISMSGMFTANAFQLTTPFGTGKLFNGVFFNSDVKEVIVAYDEDFNVEKVEARWKDATPVRILRHPFNHLNLQVPNGRFIGKQSGVAVISVNVSLLAVQYRSFVLAELLKHQVNPEYVPRNVMQFVHMHVLPNMLESYLDYALFNRMDSLWNDEPCYTVQSRIAIHLPTYDHQVSSIYSRLIKILEASSYSAPAMLSAIPVASVADLRKVMFVPDVAPTRQILWSVLLARIPMLLFLVRAAKKDERVRNQMGLHDVEVTLTRLKRQKVLDTTLPKELFQPTMAAIDEILSAL
jgi:hypothetical protein